MTSFKVMIRDFCYNIISSPIFEAISITTIVVNCIVMALDNRTSSSSDNSLNFFNLTDYIFLILYSIEMILKILGLGFVFPKDSYLRDSWNILDFIIVISGYIPFIFTSGSVNLRVLRSFRVIRPLRTISGIEGLRILVSALLSAVPLLRDTILILVFFFIIFAIAGLQIWSGVLKRSCISIETGIPLQSSYFGSNLLCGGEDCPVGYICGKTDQNPNYGTTNFDSIFFALLSVFNCVTLEGWSYIMMQMQQSFATYSVIYFLLLTFGGAYFLLNLTLAVINSKFSEEHNLRKKAKFIKGTTTEEIEKKKEKEKLRIQRKIKPFIKRRLLQILKDIRARMKTVAITNKKQAKPISLAGTMKRGLFSDIIKHPKSKSNKILSKNQTMNQEMINKEFEDESKMNGGLGIMEEESSYEMSSVGAKSSKGKHSSNKEDRHSSSSEDSEEDKHHDAQTPNPAQINNNADLAVNNKWRNKLNLSRETIVEVDEEHRSDTTNRRSTCKLIGSSDRKSSSRRFQRVLSTLKGNSPNSSVNVQAKDELDLSSQYIDHADSPYFQKSNSNNLTVNNDSKKKVTKKKSSTYITLVDTKFDPIKINDSLKIYHIKLN